VAFTGFPAATTAFLADLAANNNREWFMANKPVYEREVIAPFRLLLADVISALAAREVPLSGDPAKAIFRIHRDVRFSREKTPYKTHAGAVLSRNGGKVHAGVVYIHIEPKGSFLAAGFWQPEREALGAWREAIYTEPKRFADVQAGLLAAKLPLDTADSLTRTPRGFEDAVGTEIEPALRLKSFLVRRPIPPSRLARAGLVSDVVKFTEQALPLLEFGWNALSVLDPTDLKRQR
jgi:uncharacterized protein (TIGR02453 family)